MIMSCMLLISVFMFLSLHKHLLMTFMSLEYILLISWFIALMTLTHFQTQLFFLLVFLTLIACEGAFTLALLVTLTRSQGNDFFSHMSLLNW